jgi:hypothetical protein
MARITNYGELKAEIQDWINRKNLAAKADQFVQLAEDQIADAVRVPDMLVRTVGTFSSSFILLDEDRYLEVFSLKAKQTSFDVTKNTLDQFGLLVRPYPAAGDPYELIYYQKYAPFSDDADTNWLLENDPMVYLAAGMVAANLYIKDTEEAVKWQTTFQQKVDELSRMNRRAKYPPGSLEITCA